MAKNVLLSKKWTNDEMTEFVKNRFTRMLAARDTYEQENVSFDQCETQENAISYYDNEGGLQVNIPLEQSLIEIYMGRTAGKLVYDIVPDQQASKEELYPAKFALAFFLDGNGKKNFWNENRQFRLGKAIYGTGIFFTGLRKTVDKRYELKKQKIEKGIDSDLFSSNRLEEKDYTEWEFFPKNINIRDFYIDEKAANQPDLQEASDCVWTEEVDIAEFKLRYKDNPAIKNIDDVRASTVKTRIGPREQTQVFKEMVVLYHYFNQISKDHVIVANLKTTIYRGKYIYNDGKLPFASAQHYTDSKSFRGRGIPARIGYLKTYKSEILQDILVGAEMGSGIHLLTGNNSGLDWEIGGRGVNVLRSVGGTAGVQQLNLQPNLNYFTNVLNILDDLTVQTSGDDVRAPYTANTDKVGIMEIMEQNKTVRQSAVDENYNLCLDDSLTMMLSRIKQFAPQLLAEKITDEKTGRILKVIFPKIQVKNYEVEETSDGKIYFTKDLSKYGYFTLNESVIEGVGVKIITNSSMNSFSTIERQKLTEYVNNILMLSQVAQIDQSGAMIEKLGKSINFEEILQWMNDAWNYDAAGLTVQTPKDKKIQDQKKKLEALAGLAKEPTEQPQPTPDFVDIGEEGQAPDITPEIPTGEGLEGDITPIL